LSQDTWSDRFMAEILLAEGSYQEALTSVEKAVKNTPDDVNNRAILADCYLVLKQFERCQEEHKWIWQQYNEFDLANRLRFGWAAYITGRYAEALSTYQRLLQEPFDTGNLTWNSGLCYLAQGDLKQGEEYMSKGIALTTASHRLDLYVNFDFLTLEFSSAMATQPKEVHRVLSRIQQQIAERKATLRAQPHTAEDEFRATIGRMVRKENGPDWPWIGAHMGLGNLYLVNQRMDEARDAYQQILGYREDFPEVLKIPLLLEEGAQAFRQDMLREAEEDIRTGNPAHALELYNEIAEELLPEEEVDRAMLHAFQGYAYFVMNELDNARQHFLDLLRIYRNNDLPDGSEVLSKICNSLIPDEDHRQRLNSLVQDLAAESGMDGVLRADLNATRQLLNMLQSTNESTS